MNENLQDFIQNSNKRIKRLKDNFKVFYDDLMCSDPLKETEFENVRDADKLIEISTKIEKSRDIDKLINIYQKVFDLIIRLYHYYQITMTIDSLNT